MEATNFTKRPSKLDQEIAVKSYSTLLSALTKIETSVAEIEIEETSDKIKIPFSALKLLGDVLKAMSEGKPVSVVPIATEVTTQKAAEILGCSRPHLVKLLEAGKIEFNKVGNHRRVKLEDLLNFRQKMKEKQRKTIVEIMDFDEELGLYDS